ncbi:hypothetical protein WJX72_003392 [[Myrmecia] bisecta]|uniref:Protein kinase domain-containing protein n=1 Tax=[Myrmecia] bisecta TaxID=41462 RepID=A0AAW1PAR8_9CHLO
MTALQPVERWLCFEGRLQQVTSNNAGQLSVRQIATEFGLDADSVKLDSILEAYNESGFTYRAISGGQSQESPITVTGKPAARESYARFTPRQAVEEACGGQAFGQGPVPVFALDSPDVVSWLPAADQVLVEARWLHLRLFEGKMDYLNFTGSSVPEPLYHRQLLRFFQAASGGQPGVSYDTELFHRNDSAREDIRGVVEVNVAGQRSDAQVAPAECKMVVAPCAGNDAIFQDGPQAGIAKLFKVCWSKYCGFGREFVTVFAVLFKAVWVVRFRFIGSANQPLPEPSLDDDLWDIAPVVRLSLALDGTAEVWELTEPRLIAAGPSSLVVRRRSDDDFVIKISAEKSIQHELRMHRVVDPAGCSSLRAVETGLGNAELWGRVDGAGDQLQFICLSGFCSGALQHKHIASPKDFQKLAEQAVTAMTALHSRQVLHRDLKPENILITQDGDLKLNDFDLACMQGDSVARHLVGNDACRSPAFEERFATGGRYNAQDDGVGLVLAFASVAGYNWDSSPAAKRSILSKVKLDPLFPKCLRALIN